MLITTHKQSSVMTKNAKCRRYLKKLLEDLKTLQTYSKLSSNQSYLMLIFYYQYLPIYLFIYLFNYSLIVYLLLRIFVKCRRKPKKFSKGVATRHKSLEMLYYLYHTPIFKLKLLRKNDRC